MSKTSFLLLTVISVLFGGILPFLFFLLWSQKIKKTSIDIPDKKDRSILLIFVILSFFVGSIVLYLLNAPWLVSGLMFCYLTNTLMILIINFFWKISVHSMGIAVPTAALLFVNVFAGVFLGCFLLAVMWSRVHLHQHSLAQALAGACLGFFFTGFLLFLIKMIVQ